MTKRLLALLVMEAVAIAGLLTLALDMRAHNRVERLGGVNIWGYRGPVMRRKAATPAWRNPGAGAPAEGPEIP